MKLTIVIPCLNEATTILKAVLLAYQAGSHLYPRRFEVLVVDNGSSDESFNLVRTQGLARIITAPVRGYGAALHWGILKARGEYVAFADADLSYDFSQLVRFKPYITKSFDLILGSRFSGLIKPGAMPWMHRYLGTPVLTSLIRLIYGIPVTDSNSGMRVVRKSFYKKLKMRNSGMEWASEILIKTALAQGSYAEVPITLSKDRRGDKPHLVSWSDGWRHLKAIVLLKPTTLLVPVALSFAISIVMFRFSSALSFYMLQLCYALALSMSAAQLLQFAIDGSQQRMAQVLLRAPFVMIAGISTIFGLGVVVWIPSSLPQLRLFIGSLIVLFDVWVFLIETIKTHLINRLTD